MVLQVSLKNPRTEVTIEVVARTVLHLTARGPHLITGGAEEEAGCGDHVGRPMVLEVVRVEQKQVREVAAALKQAGKWTRKTLVGKEGRTTAKHRVAEVTFFQLQDIMTCIIITQLCNIIICILSCTGQPSEVLI